MKRATVMIRRPPPFRIEAFRSGLRSIGYQLRDEPEERPTKDDLLILWNRYGSGERWARVYEAAGAHVLVAENGYMGREWRGETWYTLCRTRHNGAGQWPQADVGRWSGFHMELAPWREQGNHVLVLPVRSIGAPPVRQPDDWLGKTLTYLRGTTARPLRVRLHPGERPALVPLEDDLKGAHCCVTWGSGAGIKAIAAGIPVIYGFPQWIGAPAARALGHNIEDPFLGDRLPMFERLANAMFSVNEIATGKPIEALLQ